ncbi:MAG: hypothetical protein K9K39_08370 [Desulfohalobiaceae bacterium]|nr:hypothetical protein [Desulfohalobiaceae bacterium]
MKRIIILCLGLFVAACAQQGAQEGMFQDLSPETLKQSTQIEVTLDQEELEMGKTPEKQLWEKGKKNGVREAVNPWIKKGYLIRPSRANVLDAGFSDFIVHGKEFEAQEKEITQVYSKRFDVQVTLTPVRQVSGKITGIEAKREMAAENFNVSLELNDLTPDERGAFFVIVQMDTALEDSEMGMIVGSGYIYRCQGQKAQGVLMETKREIRAGNLVFLLRTEIDPVSVEKKEPEKVEEEEEPEEPEVMVEPKKEKKGPELPEEPK